MTKWDNPEIALYALALGSRGLVIEVTADTAASRIDALAGSGANDRWANPGRPGTEP